MHIEMLRSTWNSIFKTLRPSDSLWVDSVIDIQFAVEL